jgi:hypothetical protein
VPVYVGLYQNYMERETRKVLPDEKYPLSFSAIVPNQRYRFPIKLEMDDNLRDELMSIVVVAATNPECQLNQPNAVVMNPGDNQPVLDKGARQKHVDFMDKQYAAKKNMAAFKFNPSCQDDQQNQAIRPISNSPDDVSIIAVGRENFGYIQVRLKKD